jgi:hypothetical protein
LPRLMKPGDQILFDFAQHPPLIFGTFLRTAFFLPAYSGTLVQAIIGLTCLVRR